VANVVPEKKRLSKEINKDELKAENKINQIKQL